MAMWSVSKPFLGLKVLSHWPSCLKSSYEQEIYVRDPETTQLPFPIRLTFFVNRWVAPVASRITNTLSLELRKGNFDGEAGDKGAGKPSNESIPDGNSEGICENFVGGPGLPKGILVYGCG
jgi:hypothetical protein